MSYGDADSGAVGRLKHSSVRGETLKVLCFQPYSEPFGAKLYEVAGAENQLGKAFWISGTLKSPRVK